MLQFRKFNPMFYFIAYKFHYLWAISIQILSPHFSIYHHRPPKSPLSSFIPLPHLIQYVYLLHAAPSRSSISFPKRDPSALQPSPLWFHTTFSTCQIPESIASCVSFITSHSRPPHHLVLFLLICLYLSPTSLRLRTPPLLFPRIGYICLSSPSSPTSIIHLPAHNSPSLWLSVIQMWAPIFTLGLKHMT